MKNLLIASLVFMTSTYAMASDFMSYQNEACGTLERVRYEANDTVKLLISGLNIKYSQKTLTVDSAMLAAAIGNSKIKTCYYPAKNGEGPLLDFYSGQ